MGYVPTVSMAFLLVFVTMLCWGSWANTMKKCGNWRFEGFYVDFALSLAVTMILLAFGLGSVSSSGWSPYHFFINLTQISIVAYFWAMFAGVVLGIGNIFFIAAISLAGISIAFPIGIGLAIIVGALLAYITNPATTSHPNFLFLGLFLVTLAVFANAKAYRIKEAGKQKGKHFKKGIMLSIISGILISLYAFPLNFAFKAGQTSYSVAASVGIGFLVGTAIVLPFLMKKPLLPETPPIGIAEYLRAKVSWHLWAIAGGVIWAIGTTFNLIVSSQPAFSVAIAYTLGQCATMIGALWGIFVWKEFRGSSHQIYVYLGVMFVLFISGIIALANATG